MDLRLEQVLWPNQFFIRDYKRRPLAVFNPGIVKINNTFYLYPRLIFEYRRYISAIGLIKTTLEQILDPNNSFEAQLFIYPELREEELGCEDPRCFLDGNKIWILYSGKHLGQRYAEDPCNFVFSQMIGYHDLDSVEFQKLGSIHFFYNFPSVKNGAVLRKIDRDHLMILFRPWQNRKEIPWSGILNLIDLKVVKCKPLFKLGWFQEKLGWSTNAVKIDDRYIVLYHALFQDGSYRHALAELNDDGELIATSNFFLSPKYLPEIYGDRLNTIYGCGLLEYKGRLWMFLGLGDFCIGIYSMDLGEALSLLIKKSKYS